MKPEFLNIDLEISTESEPRDIIHSMGEGVVVMYSGPRENYEWLSSFEVACRSEDGPIQIEKDGPPTPELITMRRFVGILERLDPAGQKEWDSAKQKVFDFGYDADPDAKVLDIDIDPRVVPLIIEVGATMRITVYRYENSAEQKNAADGKTRR